MTRRESASLRRYRIPDTGPNTGLNQNGVEERHDQVSTDYEERRQRRQRHRTLFSHGHANDFIGDAKTASNRSIPLSQVPVGDSEALVDHPRGSAWTYEAS